LRVGVLTDIHITPPETGDEWFVKALRRFDAERVDAVLVAGDLTTWTRRFEFEAAAAAWRKVFPDDRRSDGAPVERLFISGNHDVDGFFYPDAKFQSREEAERDSFFFHRDEWWREFFGEPCAPVRVKTVKGYAFVLVNWWSRAAETYSKNPARFPLANGVPAEENPAPDFLEAAESSLPRDRPFFFVQHEPLPGTVCQCEFDASLDETGRILARHPNCVAISGHMHYPLTDEHSIWQGPFTAVNASCARGFAFALPGRENGHAVGDYNRDPPFEMDKFDIHAVRQGLTMDVFADRIVFRRFDIASELPLGEDWVVPVFADGATVPPPPAAPKYSFAARAAASRPPQFASGSAVSVREIDDGHRRNARGNGPDSAPRRQVVVSFPSIHATSNSSRPWDYSVAAELRIKDLTQIVQEKRVYSPGFCMPEALDTAPVECAFAREALPKDRDIRFVVRPFDCWGNAGTPIASEWRRLTKDPQSSRGAPAPGNRESFGDTDVLVVGGGPAGVCAAIAAARHGARVVLAEQGGCLGGMATRGLVGPFMTCYDRRGETQLVRGLFEEIVQRLVAIGGAIHPSQVRAGTSFAAWHVRGHDHCTPFDPEALQFVLDDLCAEAGVRVLFHATFLEPVMEGARIVGAAFATKGGTMRIGARIVIDATGDGDVAFRADAPCELGDLARGGAMQPATTFFRIGGLPEATVEAVRAQYPEDGLCFRTLVAKARAEGRWTLPRPHVNIYRGVRDGEWSVNVSRLIGVDATNPESLSAAETEGRRQVREILAFLRDYVPGARDVRLLSLPQTVGVRETRHVLGEYRLDRDDILEGRVPDDSILLCSNSIDWHSGGQDAAGTLYIEVRDGDFYGVPYRCLVPRGVENLLVAGRCVSASACAAAAIRVMPPCMAMGQAAGTAAALSCAAGASPRTLDPGILVSALRADGAYLPLSPQPKGTP
jgi:hypothetical protein